MTVCNILTKLCYWHWLYLHSLPVHRCCFFLFLSHCQSHLPLCTATAVLGQQLVHSTVLQLSGGDGETAILCQLQGVVRYDLSVLMIPGEGGLWIPPHHHFEEHTFSLNSSCVSGELLNYYYNTMSVNWQRVHIIISIPEEYSSNACADSVPEVSTLNFSRLLFLNLFFSFLTKIKVFILTRYSKVPLL